MFICSDSALARDKTGLPGLPSKDKSRDARACACACTDDDCRPWFSTAAAFAAGFTASLMFYMLFIKERAHTREQNTVAVAATARVCAHNFA